MPASPKGEKITIIKPQKSLQELLDSPVHSKTFDAALGDTVKVKVTALTKQGIIVDLGDGVATGIIPSKESKDSLGTATDIKVGDELEAVLVEPENIDGNFILSLRKASQMSAWGRFEEAVEGGEIFKVKATSANRGGLICDIDGIRGFIPVSQLMPEHYPRVENSNSEMILEKLKKILGIDLKVRVMVADQSQDKLIFSERKAYEADRAKVINQLTPGQVLKGTVSGFSHFGIFLTIAGGIEGLIHISEIAWERVQNPRDYARQGEEIEVQVLSADLNRVAFSMKRLLKDPWVEAAAAYKEGDIVSGPITQIADYGAFVKLSDDINGLLHKSELADPEPINIEDVVKIGDEVKAKVINIELEKHRLGLSLKNLDGKAPAKPVEEKKIEKKSEKKVDEKTEKVEKTKEVEEKKPAAKAEDPKSEKKPAKKPATKKPAKAEK